MLGLEIRSLAHFFLHASKGKSGLQGHHSARAGPPAGPVSHSGVPRPRGRALRHKGPFVPQKRGHLSLPLPDIARILYLSYDFFCLA